MFFKLNEDEFVSGML